MSVSNEHAGADALFPTIAYGQKGLFTLARLQGLTFKAAMRYQIEGLSFLQRRCEQDMKLVDDLLATGDFSDAFDVCANFCQNAVMDYSREAANVTSIGSDVASDTARQLRAETRVVAEEMAAQTVAA